MKDWIIKIGMLGIIVLLAMNLFVPIQSAKSAQKYQYKVIDVTSLRGNLAKGTEVILNREANDGWELHTFAMNGALILRK